MIGGHGLASVTEADIHIDDKERLSRTALSLALCYGDSTRLDLVDLCAIGRFVEDGSVAVHLFPLPFSSMLVYSESKNWPWPTALCSVMCSFMTLK